MFLLVTDETNLQVSGAGTFFIYGGLIFPVERLESVHTRIGEIRATHGFAPTDQLKFATSSCPAQMTPDQHRAAKAEVIEACRENGAVFVVYLVLHAIAASKTQEQLVTYGVNTVLGAYHHFLETKSASGLVLVDRLPFKNPYAFLQDKFTRGLELAESGFQQRLHRIVAFASTADNASHLSSAVDIVLGAFRYAVNERKKTEVPAKLLREVVQMMWHRRKADTLYLRDYGLHLRPKTIKAPSYAAEYDELVAHLAKLLNPD